MNRILGWCYLPARATGRPAGAISRTVASLGAEVAMATLFCSTMLVLGKMASGRAVAQPLGSTGDRLGSEQARVTLANQSTRRCQRQQHGPARRRRAT
jgi:hypothetical protein